jgi:hypothetical protein
MNGAALVPRRLPRYWQLTAMSQTEGVGANSERLARALAQAISLWCMQTKWHAAMAPTD